MILQPKISAILKNIDLIENPLQFNPKLKQLNGATAYNSPQTNDPRNAK